MTLIVKKLGGSLAVVIPKSIAREMGLIEGTLLEVREESASIVLRKPGRRARRSVSAIAAQIKPTSYRRRTREQSGDQPMGTEVW